MPVRFQVDPDFYDHPKVTGMSDAAFALWVRAGSFSAAKQTDGFIADNVVTDTLRYERSIADELVRHRLWKRVRGGFQYHQWDDRNLTKERIEAERRADRERKKRDRAAKNNTPGNARPDEAGGTTGRGSNGTSQVKPQNVRTESDRNPNGIQPESERIPPVSVLVSVSESVSGSGRGAEGGSSPPGAPPPPRCPQHLEDPDPPPCGPCKDARLVRENWDLEQVQRRSAAQQAIALERAEANRAAVAACGLCDSKGYRDARPCNHDPAAASRAGRGKAAALAEIGKAKT